MANVTVTSSPHRWLGTPYYGCDQLQVYQYTDHEQDVWIHVDRRARAACTYLARQGRVRDGEAGVPVVDESSETTDELTTVLLVFIKKTASFVILVIQTSRMHYARKAQLRRGKQKRRRAPAVSRKLRLSHYNENRAARGQTSSFTAKSETRIEKKSENGVTLDGVVAPPAPTQWRSDVSKWISP
jgi:hypothetical protein